MRVLIAKKRHEITDIKKRLKEQENELDQLVKQYQTTCTHTWIVDRFAVGCKTIRVCLACSMVE